jgi:monolysocardiolipin acyltransferase
MSIVSKATVASIGLASKLFLNSGYCSSVKVNGIHHLLNELGRKDGRGVITGASARSLFLFSRLTGRPP